MRIVHPYPKPGAQKFIGVVFRDGFAHVESLHPEVEAALTQHGYTIEKTLHVDDAEAPFEPLPPADGAEKVSKRRKRPEEPANGTIAAPPTNLWGNGDPETYTPGLDWPVAQCVYATVADFEDFTDGDHDPASEDVVNAKLRRASSVIDGLTRRSVYDTDDDGYPTDPDISDAFRDATCAQLAWWDDTDDVSGAGSQEGAVSIGSVSLGAAGRTSGNGAPSAAASRVAPEAVQILTNAGLLSTAVAHT